MTGSKKRKYKIKKVFNNNVVLAIKEGNFQNESILLGKGIGFSKSKGDIIKADKVTIERKFTPVTDEKKEVYQQLLTKVDEKVIGVTEEIIAIVSSKLDEKLDSHIHIALADHISFSLKRIQEGMDVVNPFLHETKTLYSEEYELAKEAVGMIEERFDLSIPEEEIGFITLHIHSARENKGVSKTVKYTSLIKKMVDKVEEELEVEFSYESLNYARLVTHLKFGLERIEQNEVNQNPLLDIIKTNFPQAYKMAVNLSKIIERELDLEVPEDEIGYLAMHLQRLRKELD
ncbi:glucose PTS transporter transcription antiterminator GlcT [Sporohalobacter salinus]|uniref:glucose PTS transporter transcription antiterminator GlcT n=1 Tax=Sporohalobacter salinus TaxID=1494606 RepID=UPI001960E896|nr:PRD domain-containing protein [Sporohalobacter salinus]MBM7623807.1 transcriptional antiterminator [Sporohalobacter salinus]